jgi:putative transferase (TIGR04331 family)
LKKKTLIATPIKHIWPKNKNSRIVLCSEAAVLNYQDLKKKYKNFIISPNRWENKKILFNDYKYLDSLYEILLKDFSQKLNNIHSISENLNFWRIVLGPWLGNFIHIYFDRWKHIEGSLKRKEQYETTYINLDNNYLIPYDHSQFLQFSFNDYWNQHIYQNIIENFSIKRKKIKLSKNLILRSLKKDNLDIRFKNLKTNLINLAKKKTNEFINYKKYKFFFYKTYLSFKDELKLNLKFNQFPILEVKKNYVQSENTDNKLRKNITLLKLRRSKFEKSLSKILPFQIPKIFIENFKDLVQFHKTVNLPIKPKIIFTSNAAWFETNIAYYIAKLKSKNTKLIYGQHGGNYSMPKILWPEDHEKKISDKFLSWGWRENGSKVLPFYKFKNFKAEKAENKELLIMLQNRKRYFFSMDSSGGTESWACYMKYISSFLFSLSKKIKKKSILRLYNTNQIKTFDYYSNLENKFNFKSSNSLIDAFSKSKIIVHTLLSTSINDALNANLPSIIILRKDQNPMKAYAKKIFNLLYESNVLFYDTVKASKFIESIWDKGVDEWWNDKKTQSARVLFCNNFAKSNYEITQDLEKIFKKK